MKDWPEHQMLILTRTCSESEFHIEGRDVKRTTANHGFSVTEEISLPHVQECLETLLDDREGVLETACQSRFSHVSLI